MRRIKKLFAVFALMVIIFSAGFAFGCANGGGNVRPAVYVITKGSDSAFWRSVKSGADAAAAEFNVKLTFLEPSSEEAESEQNAFFERVISEKPDAVAISAISYDGSAAYIVRMSAAGLKVILFDSGSKSIKANAEIMIDNFEAGKNAFLALRARYSGKLSVGIVSPYEQTGNGSDRVNGFMQAASEDGNAVIVASANVVSDMEEATARAKELLETYSEINAIAAFNEWTTLGAGNAVEQFDKSREINVVGFDNNVKSIEHLENGAVDALVVQNPYAMGYFGVQNAFLYSNGSVKKKTEVAVKTIVATRENMYDETVARLLFPFS